MHGATANVTGGEMRCLWLTLCDPDPQTNGQFLYSGGLIRALAAAGAHVTALGLSRSGRSENRDEGNLQWQFGKEQRRPPWRKLASRLPSAALKTCTPDLAVALRTHLSRPGWDAIVLDSINVGWALPYAIAYRQRFPATLVIYIAQNEETSAAMATALSHRNIRRLALLVDAGKTWSLQGALVKSADLVCANSPDDCEALKRHARGREVHFIPPGYPGIGVGRRLIDSNVPRRAIVVGSFDWGPKRLGVEAFLPEAASHFTKAGVELQLVGRTAPEYVQSLRRRYPSVDVVGEVPDVLPYLARARIAVVPDILGGFKLKTLDYIFSRTPIFAMEKAVPGLPLCDGVGLRLFESHRRLAEGIVAYIDDFEALNVQQDIALRSSQQRFNWDFVGKQLLSLMLGRQEWPMSRIPPRPSSPKAPTAPVPARAAP
jgi:glycosyltransferase involved in cell wall biosynthesis